MKTIQITEILPYRTSSRPNSACVYVYISCHRKIKTCTFTFLAPERAKCVRLHFLLQKNQNVYLYISCPRQSKNVYTYFSCPPDKVKRVDLALVAKCFFHKFNFPKNIPEVPTRPMSCPAGSAKLTSRSTCLTCCFRKQAPFHQGPERCLTW